MSQQIIDFSALEISIASPDTIKSWSFGEVKKPETINYRTLKAEKDGLFDEKIFGPMKDYECHCGKYKRIRYKGIICDKCGVEVTQSRVRRERMGHISLAAPVVHIWFFKGAPSKLSLLLDISPRNLSSIIYFSQYVVLEVDQEQKDIVMDALEQKMVENQDELKAKTATAMELVKADLDKAKENLKSKVKSAEALELRVTELSLKAKNALSNLKDQLDKNFEQLEEVHKTLKSMVKKIRRGSILSEDEYLKLDEYDAVGHIRVGMGAESIYELAASLDLPDLIEKLRIEIKESKGAKRVKATKRLRVAEGLSKAKILPVWMFWTVVPVIPPDLRPMVQLSGGRFATSDLNDLYRRVINRNNRLKHLMDLGAPEIILRNEKRMLQEAVDALIDSAQARQSKRRVTRKPLRSLSEMLRGKQGRFRQNLLGKRVDYSGRSVIVVGPDLKLDQCGLPKDMALEMFKPYVLHHLIENGVAPNVKSAKHLIDRREPEVYDILEKVIQNHPVVLNRAPTLHKLGMQAFYPQLVEGKAIRLHPCVCAGYNADFDGDQMAVHVPLTDEAQEEARTLMMSAHNLLKPANSEPITVPNKEMALGVYYLTTIDVSLAKVESIFSSETEAIRAQQAEKIGLRQLIKVRVEVSPGKREIIETTVGRLRFNGVLPVSLRYVNLPATAKKIKEIVTSAIGVESDERVSQLIDDIKNMGFELATLSGLSVSVSDCLMLKGKDIIIEKANKRAEEVQESYLNGLLTLDERKHLTQQIWIDTTDDVADQTWNSYPEINAVKVIINSGGTRASKDQVKQLAAMRGLVVDPLGKIVEMPTKSNFRQGLSIFEYVTSARGSRKGLTDSALKTADAGYLTRRLCDVAHNVIVRMEDCGTDKSVEIRRLPREAVFASRLVGRVSAQEIKDGKKQVVANGGLIDAVIAAAIAATKVESILVRSPMTCAAPSGLCAACYGWDFSTRRMVEIGVPVGVVAAQSIGEPGTQLTMRVKHSGGIVGLDVTQGLPRVEELFEARVPKVYVPLAEISGKVKIEEVEGETQVQVRSTQAADERSYTLPKAAILAVEDGELVHTGQALTKGNLDVREILRVSGMLVAQEYTIEQVQKVYESQGIPIHDKHFEVIVRKMCDKVQIESSGDTEFLIGEVIEKAKFLRQNDSAMAAGGEPATAKVMILGITRSSLFTSSWLSAASFQHTKNVLTDAAANGAVDYLEGLKENVIIGRLIPTSMARAKLQV